MRLSSRTAWEPEDSAYTRALAAARASGRDLLDLTLSNPTQCGLTPAAETLLAPLAQPESLRYEPDPLGMTVARQAVALYYADAGISLPLNRLCLTTSTSEAYSFLFRLLCDPGDEIHIASPSYPLFDSIAQLDSVTLRSYPLLYDPAAEPCGCSWSIDFAALEHSLTERSRAIVVVHPNNPTGHFVSASDRSALLDLCARRDLALIVDEVFLDYAFDGQPRPSFLAQSSEALCFVLSGLSKVCALPQMKLSWIAASGPEPQIRESLDRLEIIADTFLSLNAPVQRALPVWLAARAPAQDAIRQRVRSNLALLDTRLSGSAATRLAAEGGWNAVLRVPRFVDGLTFAEAALDRGVLVQPGPLYAMPESRIVLSLITDPTSWRTGLDRLPIG